MTVGQLIKALQKYPRKMRVALAAHDNLDDEIQGFARSVGPLDPGKYEDYEDVLVIRA